MPIEHAASAEKVQKRAPGLTDAAITVGSGALSGATSAAALQRPASMIYGMGEADVVNETLEERRVKSQKCIHTVIFNKREAK